MKSRSLQPGHDPARDKSHCGAILEFFRGLPRNLSDQQCPSTHDLIAAGRFGVRPPNRINDLVRGKFDGHCYDFERIPCGRGVYRWCLHEPARPGYPKNLKQTLLSLSDAGSLPTVSAESSFMRHRREEEAREMPLFSQPGAQP